MGFNHLLIHPMDKLKVLIADDEADAIEVLSNLLKDSGKISEDHKKRAPAWMPFLSLGSIL